MLIVFEGVDSSGKETHSRLTYERLTEAGFAAKKISFPNYDSKAAGALRMYLDGEFGVRPCDVNPYAASAFYAVDRFASYRKDWMNALLMGEIIIADRYTTSNMIHQGAKFNDEKELAEYIAWLEDFEYNKLELPRPDKVIFMDMPMEFRLELLRSRSDKITGKLEKDIHERDEEYLTRVHLCAQNIAQKLGWNRVSVVENNQLRQREDVNDEVYKIVVPITNLQPNIKGISGLR